jgi:actin cytoskeleton-regulatory complex protein PAN1
MLPLLDTKAITVIFANVEDILLTNTVMRRSWTFLYDICADSGSKTFLSILEERQKDCRLYIDQIGDILRNNMSNMTIYMVQYSILAASALSNNQIDILR